ncbi:MAG: aldo/keto reductase [Eubacteriales bacterium]
MGVGYLGEEIKKLGFGFMRLPELNGETDIEQVKKMVDSYMEKGFTYFDTAYVYGNGISENAVKRAVIERYPRESFQVANKLPLWVCQKPEDMEEVFNTSLERVGVEYFDYYLVHALDKAKADKAEEFGAWEFVKKMKAEGKIKHIGFSFHDSAEVLGEILEKHGHEVEFVQLQINFADWEDDNVQSRKCYEMVMKYNLPVIIMEPVKGGSLVGLPEKAKEVLLSANPGASIPSWAIRYCASLDNIITVLSGMSTEEQLNDNISYMEDFVPLSEGERKSIAKVVDIIKEVPTVPCTGCKYCVDDCPMKINIPELIRVSNINRMFGVEGEPPINAESYGFATNGNGKASDCIKCKKCEGHCPQHIHITEELDNIAAVYES